MSICRSEFYRILQVDQAQLRKNLMHVIIFKIDQKSTTVDIDISLLSHGGISQ